MRYKVGLSSIPKYLTCVDIRILLLLGIFEPPILRHQSSFRVIDFESRKFPEFIEDFKGIRE